VNKKKVLYVLHYSPPTHGAAKVGDYIRSSQILDSAFTNKFIKIRSSTSITNIGKFGFLKVWYSIQLVFEVFFSLLFFRPNNIYYTTSSKGFAFFRDLIVVIIIKSYCLVKPSELFFHYHSSGTEEFVARSKFNLIATRFFVKGVSLILISKFSATGFKAIKSYKRIFFLNNGVKDNLLETDFDNIIQKKLSKPRIKVLFLSNMMKGKGYDIALELARYCQQKHKDKYEFNFAGAWETEKDKSIFKSFVKSNKLENVVNYHGMVKGQKKHSLYLSAHFFIFPSRFNEIFPVVLLEALAYGLPILALDKGGVPEIVSKEVGMLTSETKIKACFEKFVTKYLSGENYIDCRKRFLETYQLSVFESRLKAILKKEEN
jgi:glycosyltransferase involved in cell wall biosynthesis